MVSLHLVLIVLAIEAAVFVIAVLFIGGHAISMVLVQRVQGRRIAEARRLLVRAITGSVLNDADLGKIRSLPTRTQVTLFFEVTRSLSGARRQELAVVARRVGLTDRAVERCASRAWWRRLEGARLLTLFATGTEAMLPLFADSNATVRTQAAEWASQCPSPAVTAKLLDSLAHEDRYSRFAVQDALLRTGNPVVDPLVEYMSHYTGTRVEPALRVACSLADARFLQVAVALSGDSLPGVRAGAARLMGAIGGEAGVDALGRLLHDEDDLVRSEAARALGGLGHWPAAVQIAPMLRDPSWIVRREAGVALQAFGAPGTLYLRRYIGDPDQFAADMAQQVLDLMTLSDVRRSS